MRTRLPALLVAAALIAVACTSGDGDDGGEASQPGPTVDLSADTKPASFEVRPGVELATVTGAEPKAELTLVDESGRKLLTEIADDEGQAHFAYVPDEYLVVETGNGTQVPTVEGTTLQPGTYTIWDETTDPPQVSEPFRVLGRDDVPDQSFFEGKQLIAGCGDIAETRECFTYIEMRDGVTLSANVHWPDAGIWGEPPYPTVVEYSGYSPSKPGDLDANAGLIANLLGYAVVGVNMRGTGCSGGVFDVFNAAQQADGYDIIETVAREPWVSGGRVGMVGLSYPGITQLYVAATRPPHLAAIAPQSVIEDPWRQQWPGGIYNDGFTKQWLAERERQSAAGGQDWVTEQISGGDEMCEANQKIRSQNVDFEQFARALEFYPPSADSRRLGLLVSEIEVPVFLTGGWQDEQTGSSFATMLDRFTNAPITRFTMYNGHHPDGLTPVALTRWWEFLEFYVAQRKPDMPDVVRAASPAVFESFLGVPLGFDEDRFDEYETYEEALAAYEAEPPVRVLFESGAGHEVAGAPVARFEATFESWPPPSAEARTFFLGPEESLTAEPPSSQGEASYRHDPEAGSRTYTSTAAYDFLRPTIEFDWRSPAQGDAVSFVTQPFTRDTVLAAPGYVTLWMAPGASDVNVEVNLSEIQPDGTEFRVQSGWLRLGHRRVDDQRSDQFRIDYTYRQEDFTELVPSELIEVKVPVYPFAHAFREGSRLRLTVDTPGDNTPLWTFANPTYDGEVRHSVAWGGAMPSALVLMQLEGVEVIGDFPPCPSLRGQVCRTYEPITNEPAG